MEIQSFSIASKQFKKIKKIKKITKSTTKTNPLISKSVISVLNEGSSNVLNDASRTKLEFIHFKKLLPLLNKLFFQKTFEETDIQIPDFEMEIFKSILVKKKLISSKETLIDVKVLNKLHSRTVNKKTEDKVKFIIKKCIKYLQAMFLENIKRNKSKEKKFKHIPMEKIRKNRDHYFYTYYFEKVAKRNKIPLKNFFLFKSFSKSNPDNPPSAISENSISLWKLQPKFISYITEFIDNSFIKEFVPFNEKKIEAMLLKWDKILDQEGLEKGLQIIVSKFKSRGLKLPWTLGEVEQAIHCTLEYLE